MADGPRSPTLTTPSTPPSERGLCGLLRPRSTSGFELHEHRKHVGGGGVSGSDFLLMLAPHLWHREVGVRARRRRATSPSDPTHPCGCPPRLGFASRLDRGRRFRLGVVPRTATGHAETPPSCARSARPRTRCPCLDARSSVPVIQLLRQQRGPPESAHRLPPQSGDLDQQRQLLKAQPPRWSDPVDFHQCVVDQHTRLALPAGEESNSPDGSLVSLPLRLRSWLPSRQLIDSPRFCPTEPSAACTR